MNDAKLIEFFIDSVDSANKRNRIVILFLVVACVLGTVTTLNSVRFGWMHGRIERMATDPKYPHKALGAMKATDAEHNTNSSDAAAPPLKEGIVEAFHSNMIRWYVENIYSVRMPFFGINFDINDLSLVAGVSFILILTMLQFSLGSEIAALTVGFRAATEGKYLLEFYEIVAARQVLNLPEIDYGVGMPQRTIVSLFLPRLLIFLPSLVYGTIVINDFSTTWYGDQISHRHTLVTLMYSAAFAVVVFILSGKCWRQWLYIDDIWTSNRAAVRRLMTEKNGLVTPD